MSDITQTVRTLPIFPLPIVVFPGHYVPLHIFELRYRAMMKDVLHADKCFGILRINPKSGNLASTGSMIQILDVEPLEDGRMNIEGVGLQRYELLSIVSESPYIIGEIRLLSESEPEPQSTKLAIDLKDSLQEILRLSAKLYSQNRNLQPEDSPDDPTKLSYYIAGVLFASSEDQQKILEMNSVLERLQNETEFCSTAMKYLAAVAALKDAFDK